MSIFQQAISSWAKKELAEEDDYSWMAKSLLDSSWGKYMSCFMVYYCPIDENQKRCCVLPSNIATMPNGKQACKVNA